MTASNDLKEQEEWSKLVMVAERVYSKRNLFKFKAISSKQFLGVQNVSDLERPLNSWSQSLRLMILSLWDMPQWILSLLLYTIIYFHCNLGGKRDQ